MDEVPAADAVVPQVVAVLEKLEVRGGGEGVWQARGRIAEHVDSRRGGQTGYVYKSGNDRRPDSITNTVNNI